MNDPFVPLLREDFNMLATQMRSLDPSASLLRRGFLRLILFAVDV